MNVHEVPIDSIVVPPDRIREEADDTWELAVSIRESGLLHPITIDDNNVLVAGYRRLQACKKLDMATIPAVMFSDLSPIQKRTLELEENIRRKQLTWQEECRAKALLHKMLVEEHAQDVKGYQQAATWTIRDTANLLRESAGKVSEDIQLAGYVDDETVGSRKSRVEALRTMKRVRELELLSELAKRMTHAEADEGPGIFALGRIELGDCRELMRNLSDGSVHLIVTDPPYGVGIEDVRWSKGLGPYIDLPPEDNASMVFESMREMWRVLADGCYLYIFCAAEFVADYRAALKDVGFGVMPRPLIWCKGRGSLTDYQTQFSPAYETFLCAYKEPRRPLAIPLSDVFHYARPTERWHKLERHVGLLSDLIKTSSSPGETVLDAYCGGGSTLVAAAKLFRRFIGFEIDPTSWASACQRLSLLERGEEDEVEDNGPSGGSEGG